MPLAGQETRGLRGSGTGGNPWNPRIGCSYWRVQTFDSHQQLLAPLGSAHAVGSKTPRDAQVHDKRAEADGIWAAARRVDEPAAEAGDAVSSDNDALSLVVNNI